jgi:hypothetical protein
MHISRSATRINKLERTCRALSLAGWVQEVLRMVRATSFNSMDREFNAIHMQKPRDLLCECPLILARTLTDLSSPAHPRDHSVYEQLDGLRWSWCTVAAVV